MNSTPLLQLAGSFLALFGLAALCLRLASDLRELLRMRQDTALDADHHWVPAVVVLARQGRGVR